MAFATVDVNRDPLTFFMTIMSPQGLLTAHRSESVPDFVSTIFERPLRGSTGTIFDCSRGARGDFQVNGQIHSGYRRGTGFRYPGRRRIGRCGPVREVFETRLLSGVARTEVHGRCGGCPRGNLFPGPESDP